MLQIELQIEEGRVRSVVTRAPKLKRSFLACGHQILALDAKRGQEVALASHGDDPTRRVFVGTFVLIEIDANQDGSIGSYACIGFDVARRSRAYIGYPYAIDPDRAPP